MAILKKIFLYVSLFIAWLICTFWIMTTNFFEFNYPMSLGLLFLPFIIALLVFIYFKRRL